MLPNGYTDLPPGKIAAVVTYLEMTEAPPHPNRPLPAGLALEAIGGDPARYRALYAAVGEPWLWFSRAVMPEAQLSAIIADPGVEALALTREGRDIGILELDFREAGECELAFFGLVPEAVGSGLGRALMGEALRRAWARPIRRFHVHTCTLDDPRALPFYMRAGFRPWKRAVEVADDPRATGHLPRASAPGVPYL